MYLSLKRLSALILISLSLLFFCAGNVYAISLDPHNPGASPNPEMLVEAGITQVRIVLRNDEVTRNYVQSIQNAGIRVVGIINWEYGDQGAFPQGSSSNPNYIHHFSTNVVEHAYQTFGSLYAYQIWNEPDDHAMSNSVKYMDAASYGMLLGLAHATLQAHGQATISAGFVSGDLQFIMQVIAAGGTADGFAIHPYIPDPSQPGSLQQIIDQINALNSISGAPVWITEFGWPTSDQAAQAAWLAQVFSLQQLLSGSQLNSVMWYGFSDAQNPGFGLLDANLQPKLAWLALLEYLAGHPLTPEQIALLLANSFVRCMTPDGNFMGYAVSEIQCAMYQPCVDSFGNVIGYATNIEMCRMQNDYRKFCGGPIDMDWVGYRGEVVGHNGFPPFSLESVVNDKEDGDSIGDLARWLSAEMSLTASYDHTNFSQMAKSMFGSMGDGVHSIQKRTKMEHANIPYLSMNIPNYKPYSPPYGVGEQPDIEWESGETYESLSERWRRISTKTESGETTYGLMADMPVLRFNACIQRIGCDPDLEPDPGDDVATAFRCLKKDVVYNPADRDSESFYCHSGADESECVSFGRLFSFTGQMLYEEPPELQDTGNLYEYVTERLANFGLGGTRKGYYTRHETYLPGNQLADSGDVQFSNVSREEVLSNVNKRPQYEPPKVNTTNTTNNFQSLMYPSSANAVDEEQLNNGSYQSVTSPGCQNMSLLIENKGDSYGVKAWDTQPWSCPYLFDYSWTVEYFLDGIKIGSCSSPIQSGAMPKYVPDGTEKEQYGLSISDMCPVPVTPRQEGKFEVNFVIDHSNAPWVPGCSQTASCRCEGEHCQFVDDRPLPPIDCRVCESWAPPALCQKIMANELVEARECVDGECRANTRIEERLPFSDDADWNFSIPNLSSWLGGLVTSLVGSTILNCDVEDGRTIYDATGAVIGTDPDQVICKFNSRHYLIYTYPDPLTGDMVGRGLKHMDANDAMFSLPNFTDRYFTPQSAKQAVSLTLGINKVETDKALPGASSAAQALDEDRVQYVGFSNPNDDVRTMYVEYYLFEQPQVSGYCLHQRMLTPPLSEEKRIPATVGESGLCDTMDFMPGYTGSGTSFTSSQTAKNETPQKLTLQSDASQLRNLLKQNIEFDNENEFNSRIVNDPEYEEVKWEVLLHALTPQEKATLKSQIQSELEILAKKNAHLLRNSKEVPRKVQDELKRIRVKYEQKLLTMKL